MRYFFTLITILLSYHLAFSQEHVAFLDAGDTDTYKDEAPSIKVTHSNIPFKLVEGMMLVEASTNQQKGNYIIDTGAPVLIINNTPSSSQTIQGRGISQELKTNEIKVGEFNWSGYKNKNLSAFEVDISHLEQASGEKIDGIIGYDILKNLELLLDYNKKVIEINNPTNKKNKDFIAVIPFKMQAHLPIIKVKIGQRKLYLALDTASESNILDTDLLKELDSSTMGEIELGEIQGIDRKIKSVEIATINNTIVKELPFKDMKYLFTDLSHLKEQSNIAIDGLLGYPFFKQYKMSINYKKQKIYIWQ